MILGKKDAGLTPYCFFPDVQKAYDTKEYGEIGCGKKLWEYWDQRKDVENDEKIDRKREKCCDAGRGNTELCYVLQGFAQGCTLSPNLLKAYIRDMIVAVEAAKQAATMGKYTVSGLMFADDFVGISETAEGLRKQMGKALCRVH